MVEWPCCYDPLRFSRCSYLIPVWLPPRLPLPPHIHRAICAPGSFASVPWSVSAQGESQFCQNANINVKQCKQALGKGVSIKLANCGCCSRVVCDTVARCMCGKVCAGCTVTEYCMLQGRLQSQYHWASVNCVHSTPLATGKLQTQCILQSMCSLMTISTGKLVI